MKVNDKEQLILAEIMADFRYPWIKKNILNIFYFLDGRLASVVHWVLILLFSVPEIKLQLKLFSRKPILPDFLLLGTGYAILLGFVFMVSIYTSYLNMRVVAANLGW